MTVQWRQLPREQGEYNPDVDTLIRQSTIGQFQLCPARVGYQGQEGFLDPVSERMAFGTCVHYLAAADLQAGEARTDLLLNMNEWVEAILVEQYDWSLELVDKPREFFEQISVAYRNWRTHVRPTIKGEVIAIEEDCYLNLGPGRTGDIWLRGTQDVVLSNVVMDWKTSSAVWKQEKADLSLQASLYLALTKQALGVATQKFIFWTYHRPSREWTPVTTTRKVGHINSALETAYNYGLQLEAGIFPATPVPESAFQKKRGWYCGPNYCGGWNVCTSKSLADGVNEQQVAIRSWK